MKRELVLRTYQVPASDYAMNNNIVVLAVAPNGGKTEISIDVMRRYLSLNRNARILVLTHSTNVLKDNFVDRLNNIKFDFKYSTIFEKDAKIHICLPHSEHLIKGHYDLVIVDEAHENYLEKRVQSIILKTTPKKQLLLTGTPAKFIKKGNYDIFCIAANEIPEEYFAKLQIELVATSYNWSKEINNDLEIKKDYKFLKKDSERALEEILLKLIDRVKLQLTAEEFNNPNFFIKIKKSWRNIYKKLGKTIIICKSIKQASDVNEILIENNVNSIVSDSSSDKDSSNIVKFKNNEFDVLVVVDRTRLGYSDDGLYNIIDMSGTHNPNMIYQIFARALRGTPEMQKYYLKVTTQEYGMMDFTNACVCAALMLTDKKYLSTFNGDNFNGIKIPVYKNKQKPNENIVPDENKKNKQKKKFVFPEFTNDVIDMFKNIIHNLDEPVSIYKLTTIREVKAILADRTVWTWESILESARG